MTSQDATQGGPGQGDGYQIEIASVRRMLDPLEESVVAARKIKTDWESLSRLIQNSATFEIEASAKEFLSSWGFGMGRVSEHADAVVERLTRTIAAYMMAELLAIENFTPTADNIAKLPVGDAGKWAWEHGVKPDFDPGRRVVTDPWPDDDEGPVA